MKNRTVYEVLDKVMEDYSYYLKKAGNMVEISGSVYIERLDMEVTHTKNFILADPKNKRNFELNIQTFKEELTNKVTEVIKKHKEELTDDDAMIRKLRDEIKSLRKEFAAAEEELKESREKIARLELEKITTQPYQPYPWTNPNPWATGITWETQIGDPPGWLDRDITTCDENSTYCSICDELKEQWDARPNFSPNSYTDCQVNREWVQDTTKNGGDF